MVFVIQFPPPAPPTHTLTHIRVYQPAIEYGLLLGRKHDLGQGALAN